MPKTSGLIYPTTYPPGVADVIIFTSAATIWDDNATSWDATRTKWDAGRAGHTRAVLNNARQPAYIFDPALGYQVPADAFTENLERAKNYGIKWQYLTKWKQMRWTLCAQLRHMSGRALYLQQAYAQQTPTDKQPISPCSRRVTNPLASPFDWTP